MTGKLHCGSNGFCEDDLTEEKLTIKMSGRKKKSLEPDLNQWPKDNCHVVHMCLQSSALPTELSRGHVHRSRKCLLARRSIPYFFSWLHKNYCEVTNFHQVDDESVVDDYDEVALWRSTFDELVWQFHHTTTTILLSVVTVVEFASRWQMVFYTGSASHVVLSARMSVSLRSSMHIKIDMAFLVVLRLVHPICLFSSFATWLSSLSFHTCVLVCDLTRSVARA